MGVSNVHTSAAMCDGIGNEGLDVAVSGKTQYTELLLGGKRRGLFANLGRLDAAYRVQKAWRVQFFKDNGKADGLSPTSC